VSDIIDLLSNRILNVTSEEEEVKVNAYTSFNKQECDMHTKLWMNEDIEISRHDSEKFLESIVFRSTKVNIKFKLASVT